MIEDEEKRSMECSTLILDKFLRRTKDKKSFDEEEIRLIDVVQSKLKQNFLNNDVHFFFHRFSLRVIELNKSSIIDFFPSKIVVSGNHHHRIGDDK